MAQRGMMTEAINAKAKEFLGADMTQAQLRLLPYLMYCVTNGVHLEKRKLNEDEEDIIVQFSSNGYITDDPYVLAKVSKEFYDFANEILWLGYVDHNNQEPK